MVFDYEKQQDDELNLNLGDIITNVRQVCIILLLEGERKGPIC